MPIFKKKSHESAENITINAMERLINDIDCLQNDKEDALSSFRMIANNLADINIHLNQKIQFFDGIVELISAKSKMAHQMVADNEAVRGKILDIIGEAPTNE